MPAGESNAHDSSAMTRVTRLRTRIQSEEKELATTPKKTPLKSLNTLTGKDAKPFTYSPAIRNRRNSTTSIVNLTPVQNSPARRATRRISLSEEAANSVSQPSPIRKSRRLSANSEDVTSTYSKNNLRPNSGNLTIIEQSVPEEEEMPMNSLMSNEILSVTSSSSKPSFKMNDKRSADQHKSPNSITATEALIKTTRVTRSSSKSPNISHPSAKINSSKSSPLTASTTSSDKLNTSKEENKFSSPFKSLEVVPPISETSKNYSNKSPSQSPKNYETQKVSYIKERDSQKHNENKEIESDVDEKVVEGDNKNESITKADNLIAAVSNGAKSPKIQNDAIANFAETIKDQRIVENSADTAKDPTFVEEANTDDENIEVPVQNTKSPLTNETSKENSNKPASQSPKTSEAQKVSLIAARDIEQHDKDEEIEDDVCELESGNVTKTDNFAASNVAKSSKIQNHDVFANPADISEDQANVENSADTANYQTVVEEVMLDKNIELPVQHTESHIVAVETNPNKMEFPKSWSQPVKSNNTDSSEVAFIDGFVTKQMQKEKESFKRNANVSIITTKYKRGIESDEESENSSVEKARNEFLDSEAIEVTDDEEDSMNSSERAYIEENEIPIQEESIGSEDTDELISDEEEEELGSFIVSDEEVEKLSDTDSLYGNEADGIKYKTKYRKILNRPDIESSSDEEQTSTNLTTKEVLTNPIEPDKTHARVVDADTIFSASNIISVDNSTSVRYISSGDDEISGNCIEKEDNPNSSNKNTSNISRHKIEVVDSDNEPSVNNDDDNRIDEMVNKDKHGEALDTKPSKDDESQSDSSDDIPLHILKLQWKSLNTVAKASSEDCEGGKTRGGLRESIKAAARRMLTQKVFNPENFDESDADTDVETKNLIQSFKRTSWNSRSFLKQTRNVTENEKNIDIENQSLSLKKPNVKEKEYDNQNELEENSLNKTEKSVIDNSKKNTSILQRHSSYDTRKSDAKCNVEDQFIGDVFKERNPNHSEENKSLQNLHNDASNNDHSDWNKLAQNTGQQSEEQLNKISRREESIIHNLNNSKKVESMKKKHNPNLGESYKELSKDSSYSYDFTQSSGSEGSTKNGDETFDYNSESNVFDYDDKPNNIKNKNGNSMRNKSVTIQRRKELQDLSEKCSNNASDTGDSDEAKTAIENQFIRKSLTIKENVKQRSFNTSKRTSSPQVEENESTENIGNTKDNKNKSNSPTINKENCIEPKKSNAMDTNTGKVSNKSEHTRRLSIYTDLRDTSIPEEITADTSTKRSTSISKSINSTLHMSMIFNNEESSEENFNEDEAIKDDSSNSSSGNHSTSNNSDSNDARFSESESENEEDETLYFSMLHEKYLNRSKKSFLQVDQAESSFSTDLKDISNKQSNTSLTVLMRTKKDHSTPLKIEKELPKRLSSSFMEKANSSNREKITALSKSLIEQKSSIGIVDKGKQKSIETTKANIDKIQERLDSYLHAANEAKRQSKLQHKAEQQQSKRIKKKNTVNNENVDELLAEENPTKHKNKSKKIEQSIPHATKMLEKEIKSAQKAIVKQQRHTPELDHEVIQKNKVSNKSRKRSKSQYCEVNEATKLFDESMTAYEAYMKRVPNKKKKAVPEELTSNSKKKLNAVQSFNAKEQTPKSIVKRREDKIVTIGGEFQVSDLSVHTYDSTQPPKLKSNNKQLSDKDELSERSKKKKLNILYDIPFGPFREEPVTPEPKKIINGFKESNLTPKPIGFKVRSILSAGQKEVPQVEKTKLKAKRKLETIDRSHNSVWTSVGFFEVTDVENVLPRKQYRPKTHGASTDFIVKPLDITKHKTIASEEVSASALDFKMKGQFNDKIKRETSHELLRRKAKKFAYKKY